MNPRLTMICALAVLATAGAGGRTFAQGAASTCAQQWVAMGNPSKSAAKSFGQRCILKGAPVSQPISRAAVADILARQITPATPFVTTPPKDVALFCPNYATLDGNRRAQAWRAIFLAMIPFESGFNNASMMLDGQQFSIGLFQMSVTDGGCGVKREADLLDPVKNTACAVAKMTRLASPGQLNKPWAGVIGGDAGHIQDGAARYWRTLRVQGGPYGSQQPSRQAIVQAALASPGCR